MHGSMYHIQKRFLCFIIILYYVLRVIQLTQSYVNAYPGEIQKLDTRKPIFLKFGILDHIKNIQMPFKKVN